MNRSLAALALVVALAVPERSSAQASIEYSPIDRATVRVFALGSIDAAHVRGRSGLDRMIAVPSSGHGTGVVLSEDGLVLTAHHVVDGARVIAVWSPGARDAYEATVVYSDPVRDFAFLQASGRFAQHVDLATARATPLRVRETVSAIGYPLDASRSEPLSSRGIISGARADGNLQLDIALNPGNSGGPLVDAEEHLVGIVVARGRVEAGVVGVGIAVPLGPIRAAYDRWIANGVARDLARARLGGESRAAEIARLASVLARVGAEDLLRDTAELVDGEGAGVVLRRLRDLAVGTADPEVLALVAAYFWDAAAALLERRGALRASELARGSADRELAGELLHRAVWLCREAVARDRGIAFRSSFVASVLLRQSGVPSPDIAPPMTMLDDQPFVAP